MFRNKVIVITGASAGVGRATAHAFAQRGARLGLIARDPAALEQVKEEVERFGVTALVAAADVAEADAVFSAAERIANHFGAIDVWVNNAMVTVFAPVWELTPEEFRRVTEVFGCVHGTMAALRHMRPRNRGAIIQVGSALAYRGIPLQSGYCGAKHAIRGFTNSLRTELIHGGSAITVTTMELPAVNTPQFDWARTHMARQPRPVPPVVQPEVIADAIVRAAVQHPGPWRALTVFSGMAPPVCESTYPATSMMPAEPQAQFSRCIRSRCHGRQYDGCRPWRGRSPGRSQPGTGTGAFPICWAVHEINHPKGVEMIADQPAADSEPGTVIVRETSHGQFQQDVISGSHRLLADEPISAGGLDSGRGQPAGQEIKTTEWVG